MDHATYPAKARENLEAMAPRFYSAGLQEASRHMDDLSHMLTEAIPWIVDHTVLIDAGLEMANRAGLTYVPLRLPFPSIAVQHQVDGSPALALSRERHGVIEIDTLTAIPVEGKAIWTPMPTRGVFDPATGDSWSRRIFPAFDQNHDHLDGRAHLQSARVIIGLMVALSCRNIEPRRHTAPQALNAKRTKRNKPKIPDHFRVTVIESSNSMGKNAGQGVKASPIPHPRRGYVRARMIKGRRYVDWIGPVIVNASAGRPVDKAYRLR